MRSLLLFLFLPPRYHYLAIFSFLLSFSFRLGVYVPPLSGNSLYTICACACARAMCACHVRVRVRVCAAQPGRGRRVPRGWVRAGGAPGRARAPPRAPKLGERQDGVPGLRRRDAPRLQGPPLSRSVSLTTILLDDSSLV